MSPYHTPGVCNLNRPEVQSRRVMGWVGLVVGGAMWIGFVAAETPAAVRLSLAGPALVAALGLWQSRARFCVAYGLQGVSNSGEQFGQVSPVEPLEDRSADRWKALRMVGGSLLIAAVVAAVGYFTAPS